MQTRGICSSSCTLKLIIHSVWSPVSERVKAVNDLCLYPTGDRKMHYKTGKHGISSRTRTHRKVSGQTSSCTHHLLPQFVLVVLKWNCSTISDLQKILHVSKMNLTSWSSSVRTFGPVFLKSKLTTWGQTTRYWLNILSPFNLCTNSSETLVTCPFFFFRVFMYFRITNSVYLHNCLLVNSILNMLQRWVQLKCLASFLTCHKVGEHKKWIWDSP